MIAPEAVRTAGPRRTPAMACATVRCDTTPATVCIIARRAASPSISIASPWTVTRSTRATSSRWTPLSWERRPPPPLDRTRSRPPVRPALPRSLSRHLAPALGEPDRRGGRRALREGADPERHHPGATGAAGPAPQPRGDARSRARPACPLAVPWPRAEPRRRRRPLPHRAHAPTAATELRTAAAPLRPRPHATAHDRPAPATGRRTVTIRGRGAERDYGWTYDVEPAPEPPGVRASRVQARPRGAVGGVPRPAARARGRHQRARRGAGARRPLTRRQHNSPGAVLTHAAAQPTRPPTPARVLRCTARRTLTDIECLADPEFMRARIRGSGEYRSAGPLG